MSSNDTSVVALYRYGDWLFVCPGDIEDGGWKSVWLNNKNTMSSIINGAKYRILVAPHHGRPSGFSQDMMNNIQPHVAIVSDVHGQSPTDPKFRTLPLGLNLQVRPESTTRLLKFLSTKLGGRVRFEINPDNSYNLHQYDGWQ
jgi:competence protein ComEC